MARAPILSEQHIRGLDRFIGHVMDAYKAGNIGRNDAVWAIGHVTVAIDKGNENEFASWPANWTAPATTEARDAFLLAIADIGVSIADPGALRAALEEAEDWRGAVVEQVQAGREFFIHRPDTLKNELMLDFSEVMESYGFTMEQRRAVLERARTTRST
jgi:hypothetical protein